MCGCLVAPLPRVPFPARFPFHVSCASPSHVLSGLPESKHRRPRQAGWLAASSLRPSSGRPHNPDASPCLECSCFALIITWSLLEVWPSLPSQTTPKFQTSEQTDRAWADQQCHSEHQNDEATHERNRMQKHRSTMRHIISNANLRDPTCNTTGLPDFAECQLHSAKACLHSAKPLPSVTLGKAHSAKPLTGKGALPRALPSARS